VPDDYTLGSNLDRQFRDLPVREFAYEFRTVADRLERDERKLRAGRESRNRRGGPPDWMAVAEVKRQRI
jgi:hypothetical protein